jgi:hypothetical protein
VSEPRRFEPTPVRAVVLIHQEGTLALIAAVGLSFTADGLLPALAASGPGTTAVAAGIGAGAAWSGLLWLVRGLPPLARLERWQRVLVSGWTTTDAAAVALLSGLAEEALLRAWLQPVIGLVPAAALFALLHIVPDRRLWFWPVFAFITGLGLGGLYEAFGYPAAALAHVTVNLVALLRLRRGGGD